MDSREPEQREIPTQPGAFLVFVWKEIQKQKKWYLVPVWLVLALVTLLLFLSGGTTLLPAIYTFM